MKRVELVGVVVALVACIAGGTVWAADDFGQNLAQDKANTGFATAAAVPAAKPAPAGRTITVQGEVVMRTEELGQPLYLRVRNDADGRVWIFSVSSATTLTKDGASASTDVLKEGARVEAAFPWGGDNIPEAASITVLSMPSTPAVAAPARTSRRR